MLARIRKSMEEKDQGFTLIELLVVIIIIGILAAIAIPVFLSQRKKGWDAQATSDARNIATLEETAYSTQGYYSIGSLANGAITGLSDYKPSSSVQAVTIKGYDTAAASQATSAASTGSYCIDVTSKSTTHFYYNSSTGGLTTTACP